MSEVSQADGSEFKAPNPSQIFGTANKKATDAYREAMILTQAEVDNGNAISLTPNSKRAIKAIKNMPVDGEFANGDTIVSTTVIAQARDNVTEHNQYQHQVGNPALDTELDQLAGNTTVVPPHSATTTTTTPIPRPGLTQ